MLCPWSAGRRRDRPHGAAPPEFRSPPYGYRKDPDNQKHWIVDEEAAAVVRRIYRMNLDGKGVEQIAGALTRDRVLTPRFYWQSKGVNRPGKSSEYGEYHWSTATISKILSKQEYCGDVLNFKTYSKSYKNKRRMENDRENWTACAIPASMCRTRI